MTEPTGQGSEEARVDLAERVEAFKQAIIEAELHPTGSWSRAVEMIHDDVVEPQAAMIADLREQLEAARSLPSEPTQQTWAWVCLRNPPCKPGECAFRDPGCKLNNPSLLDPTPTPEGEA